MVKLKPFEAHTLELKPNDPPAAHWLCHSGPHQLVDLMPAKDGRSCVATAKDVPGQATVKAMTADRIALAYFSLVIEAPAPDPEVPPLPVPAVAEVVTASPE